MEYPGLKTLLVFFCCVIVMIMLVACSNAYEDCLDQERAEYRVKNPRASVGEVLSRQRDFEVMCSKFQRS